MNRKNMSPAESAIEARDRGHISRLMKIVFAVLVVVVLVGLGYVVLGPATGFAPKQRPVGVPLDAVWVGGADGGAYVRCAVDAARNVNHCEVWNDSTGNLSEHGDYQVRGQARAATEQELKGISFPDFAGHIYLAKGIVLDHL